MRLEQQYRIIRDPENLEQTKIPHMSILIVLPNGIVGEAKTIRGAVAIVIGSQYFDAEDAVDEWHYRVELARRECMMMMSEDIYTVVYDKRRGVISNNYAAAPGDPDYEEPVGQPYKIRVDSERTFLYSLASLGIIRIMEREDSFLLKDYKPTGEKCCNACIYKTEEPTGLFCEVYNEPPEDGKDCTSFGKIESNIEEYSGGTYIDIAQEYNLEQMLEKM